MSGVAEESILTYREEEREGFVKQIKDLIRRAGDQALLMSYVVERGDFSHLIFAQEQKFVSDLAAIGKHGRESRGLLLHVLHLEDEKQFVATIKERYERPIMDMLEC